MQYEFVQRIYMKKCHRYVSKCGTISVFTDCKVLQSHPLESEKNIAQKTKSGSVDFAIFVL